MAVFTTFFAVVSIFFNIVFNTHLPVPTTYRLALSGIEAAICGPPALSPYLQLLCGTPPAAQLPPAPASPAVLFGSSVFIPSLTLTGCLVNCTLTDEPTPVYFGPHLPPPGPVILAPKFELLAPPAPRSPPVRLPEVRPFSFFDLLTLENLLYLGIALLVVYTLWRKLRLSGHLASLKRRVVGLVASVFQPLFYVQQASTPRVLVNNVARQLPQFEFEFEDYGIYVPSGGPAWDASFEEHLVEFATSDVEVVEEEFVTVEDEAEEVVDVALAVESPTVEDVSAVACLVDDEPEEPLLLTSAPVFDEFRAEVGDDTDLILAIEDELPLAEVVEVASEVDDVDHAVCVEEPSLPSSPPVVPIVSDDEPIVEVEAAPTVVECEEQVQRPASPPRDLDAVVDDTQPEVSSAASTTEVVVASSSTAPPATTAEAEEPVVVKKRPARSGRKCKALARKREREAAAAAAAANPEEPQPQPVVEEPAVVEEPLSRDERRRRRNRMRAAAGRAAGSSSVIPEPTGPVFTESDFPPLPTEPIAPKTLEHRMSYALVTAISRPSASAVVHIHRSSSPTTSQGTEVNIHPEPRLAGKWIAASRRYEDSPKDSVWTNWTMDLEDIATFRPTKSTRRKKKD